MSCNSRSAMVQAAAAAASHAVSARRSSAGPGSVGSLGRREDLQIRVVNTLTQVSARCKPAYLDARPPEQQRGRPGTDLSRFVFVRLEWRTPGARGCSSNLLQDSPRSCQNPISHLCNRHANLESASSSDVSKDAAEKSIDASVESFEHHHTSERKASSSRSPETTMHDIDTDVRQAPKQNSTLNSTFTSTTAGEGQDRKTLAKEYKETSSKDPSFTRSAHPGEDTDEGFTFYQVLEKGSNRVLHAGVEPHAVLTALVPLTEFATHVDLIVRIVRKLDNGDTRACYDYLQHRFIAPAAITSLAAPSPSPTSAGGEAFESFSSTASSSLSNPYLTPTSMHNTAYGHNFAPPSQQRSTGLQLEFGSGGGQSHGHTVGELDQFTHSMAPPISFGMSPGPTASSPTRVFSSLQSPRASLSAALEAADKSVFAELWATLGTDRQRGKLLQWCTNAPRMKLSRAHDLFYFEQAQRARGSGEINVGGGVAKSPHIRLPPGSDARCPACVAAAAPWRGHPKRWPVRAQPRKSPAEIYIAAATHKIFPRPPPSTQTQRSHMRRPPPRHLRS